MSDPAIRPVNAAILIKLQSAEGSAVTPSGAADAVPFEGGSVAKNSPYTQQKSSEVTGSLVAGAPLVIGQAATFAFKSRLKGAGPGSTYSSTVKPPLHQALSACGKRGFFQAAIATALLSAGSTSTATLGTGAPTAAQALRGCPLVLTAGVGNGAVPFVTDYTAGKIATLSDSFGTALDTTTSAAVPANWTYAGTSPKDATARLTDQPPATIYYYEDGKLYQYVDCRGSVDYDLSASNVIIATFTFTGIFAGSTDAALPANLAVASHSAPIVLQGAAVSPAVAINRLPLPVSTMSVKDAATVESPDDPNTPFGFAAGQIGGREPTLTADPLATLIATRDTLGSIGANSQFPGVIRAGAAAGNRVGLLGCVLQPVEVSDGDRGQFRSESITYRICKPTAADAQGRDGELVLCFY